MASVQLDAVPRVTAGIRSIGCACGWEAVFLVPEEDNLVVVAILEHLGQKHGAEIPILWDVYH